MALAKDLVMQREAMRVLREQLDAMTQYFGTSPQNQAMCRRLAVLATIRDLEYTHGIELTPNDALQLLRMEMPTLRDPRHASRRKHFFDHYRHLKNEARHEKARALKESDNAWYASAIKDKDKVKRILTCINSGCYSPDVSIRDLVHVASRNHEFAALV